MTKPEKPLSRKTYGSIPHLPNSRLGPGDHKCSEGQARIVTQEVKKDRNQRVICQEKLDGSCCGVCRKDGVIIPLGRAGYSAYTSSFKQHHLFADWVYKNQDRFLNLLEEGERVVGEWLVQAHGTRYNLPHEPFVVFDIIKDDKRVVFNKLKERAEACDFVMPHLISDGLPISIDKVMNTLLPYGYHGALEEIEGAVWRVESKKRSQYQVDFLVKYVQPDKIDGYYLNFSESVWNDYYT